MKDWEETGLEQRAEMPANIFADPPDTTEAEATLEPCTGAVSQIPSQELRPSKPTAHPEPAGRGKGRSPGQHRGGPPTVTFPQL